MTGLRHRAPIDLPRAPAYGADTMFGNWLKRASAVPAAEGAEEVEAAVRTELRGADEETVLIVTAIAGLLGAVAYADKVFSSEERVHVRDELGRIHGMSASGADAICTVIERHLAEIVSIQVPRYTRLLRELGDRELRAQVLETLVALAAADHVISMEETDLLRQLTTSLGLSPQDYNDVQTKFRDKLGVLRGR